MSALTLAPEARRLAAEARRAHVAVISAAGPHTTPVAVVWSGGRLWFLTPRRSVKAHAARRGPVAAQALLTELDLGPLAVRGAVAIAPARATLLDLEPGAPPEAVLTLATPGGPVPLPVAWDPRRERATLPARAAGLLPPGAARLPACLTVLTSDGAGLRAKAGRLLHGEAVLATDGASARLHARRLVWWRGTSGGTLDVPAIEEVPRRHAR